MRALLQRSVSSAYYWTDPQYTEDHIQAVWLIDTERGKRGGEGGRGNYIGRGRKGGSKRRREIINYKRLTRPNSLEFEVLMISQHFAVHVDVDIYTNKFPESGLPCFTKLREVKLKHELYRSSFSVRCTPKVTLLLL